MSYQQQLLLTSVVYRNYETTISAPMDAVHIRRDTCVLVEIYDS
jgi:hypothetical protein